MRLPLSTLAGRTKRTVVYKPLDTSRVWYGNSSADLTTGTVTFYSSTSYASTVTLTSNCADVDSWFSWFPEPTRTQGGLWAPQHDAHVHAARAHQRELAVVRADKLLGSVLSELQRAQLSGYGWFLVRGHSGALYRVRRGISMNVDALAPDGSVLHSLCAYPPGVPEGDAMAAQKLMLESVDEQLFLKLANRHGYYGRDRVPAEMLARAA